MFAKPALLLAAAQGNRRPARASTARDRAAPRSDRAMGPRWAVECDKSDDWNKPAPPVRIHGNTYLVGSCGISSILIVGSAAMS